MNLTDEQKKQMILVGALLAVVIALAVIFVTATRPTETIGDYSQVPKKGAGRYDKD